jgi:hypothetical protein
MTIEMLRLFMFEFEMVWRLHVKKEPHLSAEVMRNNPRHMAACKV